jgi:hypothetical protein
MAHSKTNATQNTNVLDFTPARPKPPIWALSVMKDVTDHLSQSNRTDAYESAEHTTRAIEALLSTGS